MSNVSDSDESHFLLEIESELVEQTDNGWQEGDPLEQPDNPEPWHADS